ncbi:MAG: hypothetical protein Q4C47_08800, partial [Planctomycetia bacterium]|nr:hypothetical protein [Planctomycetia bacterium]
EAEQELTSGRASDGLTEPGEIYDGVLAWDMGSRLKTSEQRVVQAWSQRIRTVDRRATRRLLMGQADLSFRGFTWTLDGLVYDHSLLGTEMEFATYRDWVKSRASQTKPTSIFWVRLETQPDQTLRRQWASLDRQSAPDYFPYEMLELSVWNALSTGAKGLVFSSQRRLDAEDADTKIRAMSLELINSWLTIAEPWIAVGQMTPQSGGTLPGSSAMLFQRDRARMLMAMVTPPSGQNVLGQAAGLNVLFTVPGVPDTNRVYTVQPGRLQPEASRRIAGGCGIDFRDFGPTTMAMISAEPRLIAAAGERLTRRAERQLTLLRSLAEYRLTTTRSVAQRLRPDFDNPTNRSQFEQGLGEAGSLLIQMRRRPIRWTDAESYQFPRRLQRALRLAESSVWRDVMAGQSSVVTSPGTQLFDSLPAYMVLVRRFERQGTSPTRTGLLPGGDFEQAEVFRQQGWKIYPSMVPNLTNGAELHREAAYHGTYGLRIFAVPTTESLRTDGNGNRIASSPEGEQLLQDASLGPTVEVISPPVSVPVGTLVRISGWYRMSEDAATGCDGLEISDSVGGPSMAMRIRGKSDAWKRFVFHRVAVPPTGVESAEVPITIQFVYHGLGSVQIDSVTMELL